MCGITGIYNRRQMDVAPEAVRAMTNCMAHRGPDSDGFYTAGEIGFGHRRLAILDLSPDSNQPFTDASGRYTMVYNGEMFDFKKVRASLSDYPFQTTGDTEVLLAAFARWGPECVRHFKGMFAFAVWDHHKRELTLVRDRLGVKPLYYYLDDNLLLFASEIRSLLINPQVKRVINKEAVFEFLSYQSVGYPLTMIEGICQLEAGSYMQVNGDSIQKTIYWKVGDVRPDFDFNNVEDIKPHIRSLLRNAVESRLVSDVPVGAFLSGGIDSSVVVGLMAEVSTARPNTFTVSFEEKEFDESAYAEIIAKKFNTNHTKISLKPEDFLHEIEHALSAMDTPTGDGVNSYVVSKAIRQAGMTVALSGVGGDELFSGYPIFHQFARLQKYGSWWKNAKPLRGILAGALNISNSNKNQRFQQILAAGSPSIENLYPVLRQILAPKTIQQLTSLRGTSSSTALFANLNDRAADLQKLPVLSQVSAAEYIGYTQQTLLKDMDQMSMAVSLEVREPFFDHELIEFLLHTPDAIKRPLYPKSLLVESVSPLLPDEIVHRKKQGFLFPWSVWMKRELKSFCEALIKRASERDFINGEALQKAWKQFLLNDPGIRWADIWLFVVLEYWMEKNNVHE